MESVSLSRDIEIQADLDEINQSKQRFFSIQSQQKFAKDNIMHRRISQAGSSRITRLIYESKKKFAAQSPSPKVLVVNSILPSVLNRQFKSAVKKSSLECKRLNVFDANKRNSSCVRFRNYVVNNYYS
jgi:hypothetical protein